MALINCDECNHKVSDKAAVCSACGSPVSTAKETSAAGAQIKTVQEINKRFKLHSQLSASLFIVGLSWIVVWSGIPNLQGERSSVPGYLMLGGLIWYIVNRFRIWWHYK